MDQRLSIITLGVRNLEQSVAFYDALGWKKASEEEGIAAYNLNGNMTLSLYPLDKLSENVTINLESSTYSTCTLAYNVNSKEEVNTALKTAEAAGAKIIKPAADVFWGGYSGYFADPNGQLWEVAYNPFSLIGENGAFQWNGVK